MSDRGQASEAGGVLFDQVGDVLERDVGAVETALDAPELLEPARRPGQGDAHVPAATLGHAAAQRDHGGERHEIAGRVVERLAGQRLGALDTGGCGADAKRRRQNGIGAGQRDVAERRRRTRGQ